MGCGPISKESVLRRALTGGLRAPSRPPDPSERAESPDAESVLLDSRLGTAGPPRLDPLPTLAVSAFVRPCIWRLKILGIHCHTASASAAHATHCNTCCTPCRPPACGSWGVGCRVQGGLTRCPRSLSPLQTAPAFGGWGMECRMHGGLTQFPRSMSPLSCAAPPAGGSWGAGCRLQGGLARFPRFLLALHPEGWCQAGSSAPAFWVRGLSFLVWSVGCGV